MDKGKILAIRIVGDPILKTKCKEIYLKRYKGMKI